MDQPLYAKNLEDWRSWLRTHHDSEREVWLRFFKDGTAGISYTDAVEEALCWGWVDSLIKRVDEREYVRKFTARRPGSRWSTSNRKRARKLLDEGRMKPAGSALLEGVDLSAEPENPTTAAPDAPPAEFARALKKSPKAAETFDALPKSAKKRYIAWVLDARRAPTRERRIAEAVSLLEQGKRLGMK